MTPAEIRDRLDDRAALIATLYGEARNEPVDAIIACGCVIRNRATHPRWWGDSIRAVCLRHLQFSCWWETNANTEAVYDVAQALLERRPLGDRTILSELSWIAEGLIGEQLRDVTAQSDHYLTTRLYRSAAAPSWAKGRMPSAVVGAHTFLRLEI